MPGVAPADEADADAASAVEGSALIEPPDQAVRRLKDEVDTVKDRYLRLAAEFENFKKRMARERAETWARAQADVVSNILDALDDFTRVTQMDPSSAAVPDLLSGVQLVERKLLRELESAGLTRVGRVGESFDPNLHEAVGAVPANSPEDDGSVAAVLQVGYQFGNALLRPARVQVSVTSDDGDSRRGASG
jgi:molecular chaperone GrpE